MANPTATFNTTVGSFKAEVSLDRVSITASSFIDPCQSGFYNGIHFHPRLHEPVRMPKPKCGRAGTGGPDDGTFKNLKTGGTDRLWNCCMGLPSLIYKSDIGLISEASVHTPGEEVPPSSCSPLAGSCKGAVGIMVDCAYVASVLCVA